jgi:hypothetical protein
MKRNFAYRRWYVLKKNIKKKIQFSRGREIWKNADDALSCSQKKKKKIYDFFFGSIYLVSFKTRVRQSIDVAQKQILQKKI